MSRLTEGRRTPARRRQTAQVQIAGWKFADISGCIRRPSCRSAFSWAQGDPGTIDMNIESSMRSIRPRDHHQLACGFKTTPLDRSGRFPTKTVQARSGALALRARPGNPFGAGMARAKRPKQEIRSRGEHGTQAALRSTSATPVRTASLLRRCRHAPLSSVEQFGRGWRPALPAPARPTRPDAQRSASRPAPRKGLGRPRRRHLVPLIATPCTPARISASSRLRSSRRLAAVCASFVARRRLRRTFRAVRAAFASPRLLGRLLSSS